MYRNGTILVWRHQRQSPLNGERKNPQNDFRISFSKHQRKTILVNNNIAQSTNLQLILEPANVELLKTIFNFIQINNFTVYNTEQKTQLICACRSNKIFNKLYSRKTPSFKWAKINTNKNSRKQKLKKKNRLTVNG